MRLANLILLLILPLSCLFSETVFYVSPNGNDTWSGKSAEANAAMTDGPFATLSKAQLAARGAARTAPVTIFVREGTYRLEQPWLFEPIDSGTKAAPVTYKNYSNEQPVISGGMTINGWQTQGSLWVTTIERVKSGKLYFKELYVNNERRDRARKPNKGEFLRINGGVEGNDHRAFRFNPGDLSNYQNPQDVNICLYQSWLAIHLWIDNLDLGQNTVTFSPYIWFAAGEFDNHTRYYVENALEFLDQPGEWYLNRKTGELFYYPLPGETPETCEVIAPIVDRVLELRGNLSSGAQVKYLAFEGLSFRHADWIVTSKDQTEGQSHTQLDDAVIYAKGAANCSFKNCDIALGGAHGIIFTQGSSDNLIEQCHIHQLGGGGVYIGNTSGSKACESPSSNEEIGGNSVNNCFIHDLTNVHHGSVGVWVGCSFGNTITHNEICDLDYTGVSVGWCWGYAAPTSGDNLIAYNHIHHLGQGELSDMGGIYTLGVAPGTELHHNLIHDVYAYSYGGWGIYPDEGSSELLIENNITYDTKSPGFHQHYGQSNLVRNNIFALSETAGLQRTRNEEGQSFTFERNIILTQNGEALWGNWSDGNFTINRNLYWDINSGSRMDFGLKTFAEWQALGADIQSKVADPLFLDPANGNFSLSPASPAAAMGFESISINDIGLVGDASWTALPLTVTHRPVNAVATPPVTTFFNKDDLLDPFEQQPTGSAPAYAQIFGVSGPAGQNIYITDEKASSGVHSLKFDDKPLAQNTYEPFLYYMPNWYDDGVMSVSYDLYMQAGSSLQFEYRDELGYPNGVGPNVAFAPGQTWKEGTVTFKLPVDEWFHVNLTCGVGSKAGTFDASVTVNGQTVNRLDRKVANKTWKRAMEVYFISNANVNTAFYIDNLHFVYQRDGTLVQDAPTVEIPAAFSLAGAYPNPFNPSTTIRFTVADPSKEVTLEVYNLLGRRVRTLLSSPLPAGRHAIHWDGRDDAGRPTASGIYWVHMRVQDSQRLWRQKMTLLR